MAWETITHTCGHTERHQLYGDRRKREWRAGKLRAESCPACAQARREAEFAAANAVAAETSAAEGLPALTGSLKQIAWAESIRRELLESNQIPEVPSDYRQTKLAEIHGLTAGDVEIRIAAIIDAAKAARADLIAQTDARWWIDHRETHRHAVHKALRAAEAREFDGSK